MNDLVRFSWNIHRKCNFRCPYCWWNDRWDTFKPDIYLEFDKLVQAWKRVYELYGKCHIDILGGEPSIYPQINELLLEMIKYHEIIVTTNLSGSFDKLIDNIPLDLLGNIKIVTTFHPMFANLTEFIEKAIKIKNKIGHWVIYLAYPPQIKDLKKYKNIFEKNGIKFEVLTFWGKYNGKNYPDSYTKEEKTMMGVSLSARGEEKFQTEPFIPTGKFCNAGHKYALIDPDGTVLSCGGGAVNIKTNFFDPKFKLLDKPMICPSKTCPCNEWAELLVEKVKNKMKKALIVGITGQDGSYLAELLLSKGYEVHGIVRRSSNGNLSRIKPILGEIKLHFGDVSDSLSLFKTINEVKPDEIYNLAAQSQVYVSFEIPEYTSNITGLGAIRLLESIKILNPKIKYFQAVSSEIFGNTEDIPQTENTNLNPNNPYGVSKLYAYQMSKIYREKYHIFACNGILYNHESPRRSENFVTRKITKAISKIVTKEQSELLLGNIDDKRDWGYAKDYVEAMYLMLQQNTPDDYIISTGETHSVRDFLDIAFGIVNLDWHKYVRIDQNLVRPLDTRKVVFKGDNSKAKKILNWKPKTSFKELVKLMVEADLMKKGIK